MASLAAPPGPAATFLVPGPNSWAGCSYQQIVIDLYDADGIDTLSIELTVNGTTFYYPDAHLSFTDDSILTFTPSDSFRNGDTVSVVLVAADDVDGIPLTGAPLSWQFFMDTS